MFDSNSDLGAALFNNVTNSLRHFLNMHPAIRARLAAQWDYQRHYVGWRMQEEIFHNDLLMFDRGIQQYNEAIRLKPDYAEAYYNRAFAMFAQGDLEAGWRDYEWRFKCRDYQGRHLDAPPLHFFRRVSIVLDEMKGVSPRTTR